MRFILKHSQRFHYFHFRCGSSALVGIIYDYYSFFLVYPMVLKIWCTLEYPSACISLNNSQFLCQIFQISLIYLILTCCFIQTIFLTNLHDMFRAKVTAESVNRSAPLIILQSLPQIYKHVGYIMF